MDKRLLKAAISGNSSELKHLVMQNPTIDLLGTTPQKNTCLHISSLLGHENFCSDALTLNRSLLFKVNTYGETPLIVSVTSGHVSLASALLKLYQQLNLSEMILKQDDNGDNALHHAIRNGHSDLALELIVAEPYLSQGVNRYNESPMYIAISRDFYDVLEKLLEIPCSSYVAHMENALHTAVRNGNPGIAKKIVEACPGLAREEDEHGATPMQAAVLWNRLDVIRVLLEYDPSLGYLVNSKSDIPLLVSAAFRGNVGVAQEILKYCPDAPYSRPGDWTMLHQAVNQGHEHFVEFILKAPQLHKLINMRDANGDTALHIAVKKCNPKIVSALLAHKATHLTAVNNRGLTAEGLLEGISDPAITLNRNEVLMMMSRASSTALTFLSSHEGGKKKGEKNVIAKSIEEIKSLTKTYTRNTSLIAILIATITFAVAFTLPGGYSNNSGTEGLPIMAKEVAFKAFLISDTLAMCTSLMVAVICNLAKWEDLQFLLYYISITKKLMSFAYMATTMAFATGLYTVLAPRILWLAILICIVSIGLPFLTKLLVEWPLVMFRIRLGRYFQSELLDMV